MHLVPFKLLNFHSFPSGSKNPSLQKCCKKWTSSTSQQNQHVCGFAPVQLSIDAGKICPCGPGDFSWSHDLLVPLFVHTFTLDMPCEFCIQVNLQQQMWLFCFQEGYAWQNSDPVACQLWRNYNFGKTYGFHVRFSIIHPNTLNMMSSFLQMFIVSPVEVKILLYKSAARNELHPPVNKTNMCVALLLSNLAAPDWIPVKCDDQITPNVLCHFLSAAPNVTKQRKEDMLGCYGFHIVKNHSCYSFLHVKTAQKCMKNCNRRRGLFALNLWNVSDIGVVRPESVQQFYILLEATSVPFPPIVFADCDADVKITIVSQHWFISEAFYRTAVVPPGIDTVGFEILQAQFSEHPLGNNVFVCKTGIFISSKFVCDDKKDCPDGSDDNNCTCRTKNDKFVCNVIVGNTSKEMCSSLYFKTRSGFCTAFSELHIGEEPLLFPLQNSSNRTIFACSKNGIPIDMGLLNDLVPDCFAGADELALQNLLRHGTISHCSQPHHIPCVPGHIKCYDVAFICSYQLTEHNLLFPCRTGGHLESCKEFECNMKFKCNGFYCIPWGYLCDGKWDCPFGFDEDASETCLVRNCTHLYKCKDSKVCVHVGVLCDETKDCPQGEDEDMCQAHLVKCPATCLCVAFAIQCLHVSLGMHLLSHKLAYTSASFSFCVLFPLVSFFRKIDNVSFLDISKNNISILNNIPSYLKQLRIVHLSSNVVTHVKKYCFSQLRKLKTIQLDQNIITRIEERSFNNLTSFISLNVSSNKLTCIEHTWIRRMQNPILLSVMNNPFEHIDGMLFSKLPFKLLETNDHWLCCIFPHYDDCSSLKAWCVSCSNLLRNSCVQTVFITTNCILLMCCILSTSAQIISIHRKKHTSQIGKKANICIESNAICIDLCSIFFAAYLCVIWVADLAFSSTFVLVGDKWRAGVFCFLSFALVLMFSFVSPLLFSILASSRFDAVHQPLTTKFKEIKYVLKYFSAVFSLSFLVVTSLTCVTYFVHNSVPVSLCLPFANPSDSRTISKVIVGFVTSLQTCSSAFIASMHVKLVQELKKSSSLLQTNMQQKSRKGIIFQLAALSLCNNISWLPACIIFSTLSLLDQYPTEIVMWTAVTIMPVNSILSAFIFSIVAMRKLFQDKWQKAKWPHTRV